MTITVKLNASALGGGTVQTLNSGTVRISNTDGSITVSPADVPSLLAAGCTYFNSDTKNYLTPVAPAVASAGLFFASAALSNGTLAIAAQADLPRPAQYRINPGSVAIAAGTLTLTYTANDGTTTVDVISLVTAASTNVTGQTSKGVVTMSSQVVAGLSGGSSPGIQIGTNANIAVPMPANAVGAAVLYEYDDATLQTTLGTITNTGIFTPHTAINATHTYTVGYTYLSPDS